MKRIAIAMATTAMMVLPAMAQTSTSPSATPPSTMSKPATSAPSGSMGKSDTMSKPDAMSKPETSASTTAPTFMDMQAQNEWRASKLIGAKVMGPDDKSIGDVNELILDGSGAVHGVVIGVGGFLGIGEKAVAVPFKALNVQRDQKGTAIQKISVSFTKDQLKSAPTYKYLGDKSSSETTASGSRSTTPATRGGAAPANSK